jgi:hypothetical protein
MGNHNHGSVHVLLGRFTPVHTVPTLHFHPENFHGVGIRLQWLLGFIGFNVNNIQWYVLLVLQLLIDYFPGNFLIVAQNTTLSHSLTIHKMAPMQMIWNAANRIPWL